LELETKDETKHNIRVAVDVCYCDYLFKMLRYVLEDHGPRMEESVGRTTDNRKLLALVGVGED
jgi:hypothetical protein